MYLGNFSFDLIHPFPQMPDRPEFQKFYDDMKAFLRDRVDPVKIDTEGEYPAEVIDGLAKLGAFGMKIPKEYGGLGLYQAEYDKVMKLLGSYDGNLTALLSAHQSIGVPQPLKLFGTEEQKKKYLPRFAQGAISAFALTEPDVGSDPARMSTHAVLEGDHYILNGQKLWCTNGTLAEIIVVMAVHPDTRKISAFIVEMDWPGVVVEHRCRFMGLKALANAVISFTNVKVPKENLIGKEGQGLKIALTTLNTGRLALPAGCVGGAKVMLEVCRDWCNERVQWGRPIGKHEAISHKLAEMAATTFAMEAVTDVASRLADRGGYDIRIEAAAAKEYNSEASWRIIDDAMQIRGGRGYETETSLAARGERPIGVERAQRDSRINRIFEGSTEIMHLFMAREAVDKHLQVAGAFVNPKATLGEKLKAIPGILSFYAKWYPTRWIGWGLWPRYSEFGSLAGHLRFCERNTRRLAREIFHGMMVFQARMQHKQGFLHRVVHIGSELFAMAACVSRVDQMEAEKHPRADEARELADLFCRMARRRVSRWFTDLWFNEDELKNKVAKNILGGKHAWLEEGALLLRERNFSGEPADDEEPPAKDSAAEPSEEKDLVAAG
jgi:alkylation response protein AidB-like acyl-CoA dehydrogenase